MPIKLVIPTSLQMGWIQSQPYCWVASETGRDVAKKYVERPLGTLPQHNFASHVAQGEDFNSVPKALRDDSLKYLLEVFVDDYISLAIPTLQEQMLHVGNTVMHGIHNVFPPDAADDNDPISLKNLKKLEAMWALNKEILGFKFDGAGKTMWLSSDKRDVLLRILKGCLQASQRINVGIPLDEFESVLAKLRHAFTTIPDGNGLMLPGNQILAARPRKIYLHRNEFLRTSLADCKTLLQESTLVPTRCNKLVMGWPDFVGNIDASRKGWGA